MQNLSLPYNINLSFFYYCLADNTDSDTPILLLPVYLISLGKSKNLS